MAFEKLFEPLKIGKMTVRNRYCYAPLNFVFQSWDGMINEEEMAYVVARSRHLGYYTFGAVCMTKIGARNIPFPIIQLTSIDNVPGLANLAESIHLCGAKAILQAYPSAGGRGKPGSGIQAISPSGVKYDWGRYMSYRVGWISLMKLAPPGFLQYRSKMPMPRPLETEEVEALVKEYAENCKLAVLAGWDGIEMHLCHDYLVDQFRSPVYNKRTDKYGGSEDNRNRFILELAEATIKSVREFRKDFVVGARLSSDQYDGFPFAETLRLAKQLEELGTDYHSVTRGLPEGPKERYDKIWSDGGFLQWSKELKKVLKIPVVTSNIHDPKLAEEAVSKGWTDMVAVGRPLVADPDFVLKVKENRLKDINECKQEEFCGIPQVCGGLPGRCFVNPEVGRERYNPKYIITKGFKGTDCLPYILRKKADLGAKTFYNEI